jgi:hypothetical protein
MGIACRQSESCGRSGVQEPAYGPNAMITFRDPDNIRLELFWQAEDQSVPC